MKLLHRDAVYRRDKYRCRFCGRKTRNLTIDHILPLSRGGHPEKKANLLTSCQQCNQRKANRTPEEAGMSIISEGYRYTPPGRLNEGVTKLSPNIYRLHRMSKKKVRRAERIRRKQLLADMKWKERF